MSSMRSRIGWVSAVAVLAALSVGALGAADAYRRDEARVANGSVPPPPPARVSPRGTEASPVTWRLPRAGDRAVDAVVVAYQGYLGTTVRLTEAPDPSDPALPLVATGPRLADWQRFLLASAGSGASARGPVTAAVTVVATGPSEVTLLGCTDYTRQRTVTAAGASPGRKVAATVVLVRSGAVWKVETSRPAERARCR